MCSKPGGGTSQYKEGFLRLDFAFGDLDRLRLRPSRLLDRCLLWRSRSLDLERRRLSLLSLSRSPLSRSRSLSENSFKKQNLCFSSLSSSF